MKHGILSKELCHVRDLLSSIGFQLPIMAAEAQLVPTAGQNLRQVAGMAAMAVQTLVVPIQRAVLKPGVCRKNGFPAVAFQAEPAWFAPEKRAGG